MLEEILNIGFTYVGQFRLLDNQPDLIRINVDYNPANIVWMVVTNNEVMYVGQTGNPMNIVITDLENGNRNRETRNRIHILITQNLIANDVYFLVDTTGENLKKDLILLYQPIGNINGQ